MFLKSVPYFENDNGVKVHRVDNYIISPNNFIDWIMQMNFAMVAKANEIIAKEIGERVKRGTTGLYGKGMYTNEEKLVLILVLN